MSTEADTRKSRWPSRLPGLPWLLLPIPVAMIQLFGIRGAAMWGRSDGEHPPWNSPHDDQPNWEDITLSPAVYLLGLLGPLTLFALRRYPRTVIVVTTLIAAAYYSLGFPAGPVFLAPLVAVLGWFKIVRGERAAAAKRVQRAEAARIAGIERLRIAQELHDVLAHHISLINVQSGVALHLVDEKPEQTRTALTAIKGASKEALTALRGALDALRNVDDTAPRAPTAGLDQLEALVDSVRQAGLEVTLRVDGDAVPLSPATDLAALRIIQESLTNVLRHSGAGSVRVTVAYDEDRLRLSVVDNGRGGVAIAGNGLTGMAERATAVGGTCQAGPAAGGGFEVRAELPL